MLPTGPFSEHCSGNKPRHSRSKTLMSYRGLLTFLGIQRMRVSRFLQEMILALYISIYDISLALYAQIFHRQSMVMFVPVSVTSYSLITQAKIY